MLDWWANDHFERHIIQLQVFLLLEEEVYFENNVENGPFVSYYKSGKLKETGTYADGLKTGEWKSFDEEGTLITGVKEEASDVKWIVNDCDIIA